MGDTIYRKWAAGLCPCCGADLCPWTGRIDGVLSEIDPGPVAEGVMFCGRCMAMEHLQRPEERHAMDKLLMALARRDDSILEGQSLAR